MQKRSFPATFRLVDRSLFVFCRGPAGAAAGFGVALGRRAGQRRALLGCGEGVLGEGDRVPKLEAGFTTPGPDRSAQLFISATLPPGAQPIPSPSRRAGRLPRRLPSMPSDGSPLDRQVSDRRIAPHRARRGRLSGTYVGVAFGHGEVGCSNPACPRSRPETSRLKAKSTCNFAMPKVARSRRIILFRPRCGRRSSGGRRGSHGPRKLRFRTANVDATDVPAVSPSRR